MINTVNATYTYSCRYMYALHCVAPVHYFELEPPQHISTKAKQQNKSQSQGPMAMSKLYSLPELATPMELHGEERNSQNVVNYPREQKQKVSAASLPPSITQHSSTQNKDAAEQEKDEEPLPIYSIPDQRRLYWNQWNMKRKK